MSAEQLLLWEGTLFQSPRAITSKVAFSFYVRAVREVIGMMTSVTWRQNTELKDQYRGANPLFKIYSKLYRQSVRPS